MDINMIQEASRNILPGYLGIEYVEAAPDKVVGRLAVRQELCTLGGIIHGGSLMALADTLGAVGTFMNMPPNSMTTTIESKTNFIAAARLGDTVTGTCVPIHKGRKVMVWQTELRNQTGKLVALVSQSQMVLAGN